MSSEQGFVNLRLNHEGDSSGNESFWPSFTDIMTVIVMIFLIALVILLMRNMDLVQQLRNTMEAERMAAELARTTGEEKESLSIRLINTENELTDLRLQLMKMQEIRVTQLAMIKDQMNKLTALTSERDQLDLDRTRLQQLLDELKEEKDKLALNKTQLENRLLLSNDQMAQIQLALENLQNKQEKTQNQLSSLQSTLAEKEVELEQAQGYISMSDEQLAMLRGDYDDLKVKYDKLVRPARTAAGKHVVEVRYTKTDDKYLIGVKTPESTGFKSIQLAALDKMLNELKKKHPNKLYIKVIFPENSGLSYSEAWEFTSRLHKKYDYYFQEE